MIHDRMIEKSLVGYDRATKKSYAGHPVVVDYARELTAQEAAEWIIDTGASVSDDTGLQLPAADV